MQYASCSLIVLLSAAATADHPLSKEHRETARREWEANLSRLNDAIAKDPDEAGLYSRRGDTYFFLGQFEKALADYDKMVELDPDLGSSHWRRGIARFYAGKYKEAAAQFDSYNSFDNVDRENGIWRYFSHLKAFGKDKARAELLKYEKDDREPFPSVYKLFAGEITPAQILKGIRDAKLNDADREKRLFYAELYIGLNFAVEGKSKEALPHLEAAVANKWAPKAGYGPSYMWQVGRLHYEMLLNDPRQK